MFCAATPFRPPSKEKGPAGGRNDSGRPASTASLSTGKGTSCGPLVCLCYIRVAMHGRSFPSARVIVVVLPLLSVLNVFPSVDPTNIVNVLRSMYSIRRFRTKLTYRGIILLCCISFELPCCCFSLRRWGGGSTIVIPEPRHRSLLLVSYRTARIREFPPQPTGRGTNTRCLWRPRPPMVANH